MERGSGCSAPSLDSFSLIIVNDRVAETNENIVTIFYCLDAWDGVFAFNELSEQIMMLRPLPNSRGNPSLFRLRPIRDDDINNATSK